VCALLALAVLASGVGLGVGRSVAEEPKKDQPAKGAKDEPKKEQPKKEKDGQDNPFGDLDELFKRFGEGQGGDEMKEFRRQMREVQKRLEEMRKNLPARGALPGVEVGGFPFDFGSTERQGRLGVRVEKPSETLVEQLDLPKDQCLVIQKVVPDTPAAKAGLKDHDILGEVAGKPVPSDPAGLVKMLDEIKANEKFDAVVLRKGKKETLKDMTLPEAKAAKKPAARNPFGGFANPFGGGGKNVNSTVIIRNGDQFTVKHRQDGVSMTLTGSVEDGKAKFAGVEIKDGDEVKKYDSLDKVPQEHREKVKELLESAAKGKVELRN